MGIERVVAGGGIIAMVVLDHHNQIPVATIVEGGG